MIGGILFAVATVVGVVVLLWRGYMPRGSDLRRIRQWADGQGYAVLQMRRCLTFREIITRAFGCGFSLAARGYEVRVQDDQGGQFTVVINMKNPRHFETRRL